jgi:acyl-homoserine lactone acylase PvdQ
MKTRRTALALFAASLAAASILPSSAGAQTGPPAVSDFIKSVTVIPPGQDGNLGPLDFALYQAGGTTPAHYDDQRLLYAGLIDDQDVTEAELLTHFHEQQFGPAEVADSYSPRDGVTVYRDAMGVPHVYGDTVEDVEFGLGYVTGEDRLFQADVFRHAALGTLASFVGPSYLEMDRATRLDGYTEAELQAMLDALPAKFPRHNLGKTIVDGLNAYSDGMNAYMDELLTRPDDIPAEYLATGNFPPDPWRPIDSAALGVLQLRVFGETAGAELRNAQLYRELIKKHGPKLGQRIFDDIRRLNDPSAYSSIQPENGRWNSQRLPRANAAAIAIPDAPAQVNAQADASKNALNDGLRRIGFPALGQPASNAVLVSATKSATGNSLEYGAPQVGYSVPQFFMDIDAHGGTPDRRVDFRGGAVPGASLLAAVGRGVDYAWTLTTGYSDAVDTRAELLCDPTGKAPTVDSKAYVFNGTCVPMQSRTETISWNLPPTELLNAPDFQLPGSEEMVIDRTQHGPVFVRGTIKGKPVAFVKQRLFWKRELESFAAFAGWNSSSEVHSMADFFKAADNMTVSFNVFYADQKHIGYWHIGEYPLRAKGVDPRLPSWGTGAWEWKGVWPYAKNPHVLDPKQGWLVNWNNKPSAGWDNGDDTPWGDVHRVRLLAAGMRDALAGGHKLNRSDVVDVVRKAAVSDLDAVKLGPLMANGVTAGAAGASDATGLTQAADIVAQWVEQGANRVDHDHDGKDDNGPATMIFDTWFNALAHKVYDDELGDAIGLAGVPIADLPDSQGGGFWADFGNYLQNLLARRPVARPYCDDMATPAGESCATTITAALRAALAKLSTDQGTADMTKWTRDADMIHFTAQGAGTVDDIPWQNRGTYNHVAEITGHRP